MAYLNYENKRGSGKKLKVHFDLPDDDDCTNISHQKQSSISSESSLDSSEDTEKDDNSLDNADSKYSGYGSPVWSFQSGSVTQSPPVQFMNSPGYDPNRIPASVFSPRPASPMEWSVTSNESLFSIHLGNNSFSRDQFGFGFNNKSGELPRLNDLPPALPPVQEVNSGKVLELERRSASSSDSSESSDSPVEGEKERERKSDGNEEVVVHVVEDKKTEIASEEVGTTIALEKTQDFDVSKEVNVQPIEEPKSYNTVSYRSVESDMSTRSFQFPILTADGGRTSSVTVDSEKQQEQQQPEQSLEQPLSPKTEPAPKQSGRYWCFCFFCSPCF